METFSALMALCAENSPVTAEFPLRRPVTRSFGIFFDLRLNKRLSEQSWVWVYETPSRSLLRHCNELTNCRGVVVWPGLLLPVPFSFTEVSVNDSWANLDTSIQDKVQQTQNLYTGIYSTYASWMNHLPPAW